MIKKITQAATLAALLAGSATASAGVLYEYNRGAGNFGGSTGMSYNSISTSYNTFNDEFSFSVDYNGQAADGGWLVVSPGPNPKGVTDELGIAYFDAATGDVWLYAYNGENNNASYQSTDFLGYYAGAYSTDGSVGTLAFDATDANAMLETGFAFGAELGVWFHPSLGTNMVGDANGLDSYTFASQGWWDTRDLTTNGTQIPEPSSMLLAGLGLGIMGLRRRLKA